MILPGTNDTAHAAPIQDELVQEAGTKVELYEQIAQTLANHPEGLQRVCQQTQRVMSELGVTYHLYHEEVGRDHVVPLDPFPRIIEANDWHYLSSGIRQRVEIWNAFFRDIYDSQEILKAGVIPFELVYDDPRFQRQVVGVPVPQNVYVHVAAFDLARNEKGRWEVIGDFVSRTTGASYALQARNVLSQVTPEMLRLTEVFPVHLYPTELLEHLRRFSQTNASEPRVVLLSQGIYNHSYYEDSYLARQMGMPLVRGGDLIVLNSRVYLKTIIGLEPIDVIYRRTDDRFIDPVGLSNHDFSGIPGLMNCVRRGTVTLANSIGTGLGDSPAIAGYLPRMARFYLNQPLQLPSVRRLLCFDPDQCDEVLGNIEEYRIISTRDRSGKKTWNPHAMTEGEVAKLRQQIRMTPLDYVAEPYMPRTTLPVCQENDLVPRHAGLRLFSFGGPDAVTPPCALTRFSTEEGSRTISSGKGGGIKDTWILPGRDSWPAETGRTFAAPQRRLRLGSRIAESLFWAGRYAERAENTTRILRVLQAIQIETQSQQNPESWMPLWEALARATGHPSQFFKRSAHLRKQSVSYYIMLDRRNPASVLSCVERCRWNAQATRESVPPEVWAVINRTFQLLEEAVPSSPAKLLDLAEQHRISELQREVLNQLDALAGAAGKSMLRDDGWQFWNLGVHLERAVTTSLVTHQVLAKRKDEPAQRAGLDTNLDALLRMLSSLYAYRSLYQARPTPQNVVTLLLQDPQLPRSVVYCLDVLCGTLRSVFGEIHREASHRPGRLCAPLHSDVSYRDLSVYFERKEGEKPLELTKWLEEIVTRLNQLATAISDHYLNHQANNILR